MEEKFDKIRKQANSKLENQKLYGQTLIAIEEIIREQQAELSPTAYFGAILTTIQSANDANDVVGALLYLLDEVLTEVPVPILRSKFGVVIPMLDSAYEQFNNEQPIVRSIIGCYQGLLVAQDAQVWSMPTTKKCYQALLVLSANASPKARKRAQDAVRTILSQPPPPATVHPAASITAEFILRVLHEATKTDQHAAQQILALLQSIVEYWPPYQFTVLCQTLLQLPKLNNIFLTKAAFDVFEALFDAQEMDIDEEKITNLLSAICELKPASYDERLLPTWLMMISKAYPIYARLNPKGCAADLPTVFDLIFNDFQQESRNYTQIANCLSTLISYCITDDMISQASMGQTNGLSQIIATVETGLGVHFQSAWKQVMIVQETLFRKLHRSSSPLLNNCLALLGEIRLSPGESYKEQLDKTLGAAIATMGPESFLAILPLNLETPASSSSVGRAFLLPLLKNYTTNTTLAYFVDELIPLGDRLAEKAESATNRELALQAKVYETLLHQIWSLAPGFCDLPLDLTQAFTDTVAERFSSLLYTQPELRPTISQALQFLVQKNQQLAKSDADHSHLIKAYGITKAEATGNLEHLSKFAVNYLAVFFNVYSQIAPTNRGFMSEVIKSYLAITSPQDINETFKKVLGLLSQSLESGEAQATGPVDPNLPPPMSQTMLDLSIIMIPFLDVESAELLYNGTITSLLDKEDAPLLQKKGYKILNHLMVNPNGLQVIRAHFTELQAKLVEASLSCTVSARKDRVKTLMLVVRLLDGSDLHFIPAIMSEIVVALKDSSEKCRNFAFTAFVDMGNKMKEGGVVKTSLLQGMDSDAPDAEANLNEFFTMLTAGLAGTTAQMIGATITALSRVFFEFKDDIPGEMASELLQTVNVFVASNNREIVKGALGYIKVCIVVLDNSILGPQLDSIVDHILKCSHQHRNFKLKIRHVFERLIRRFGYDAIAHLVPEEDKKLIANIQKRRLRAKRQKKERALGEEDESDDEDNDNEIANRVSAKKVAGYHDAFEEVVYGSESELEGSDDDGDVDMTNNQKKKKKAGKQESSTYIRENADDVLDFLDRSALGQISSSKPTLRKGAKLGGTAGGVQSMFAENDEGRLVINDDESKANQATDGKDDDEENEENYYLEAARSADGFTRDKRNRIKFKKGGKDEEDDNDMDVDEGSGKKKKKTAQFERIGKEFRSKRAGGDVKRKNQADPYSYVPLNKVIKKKGKQTSRLTFTGRVKK
ncbi:NUC173 domain-containing protein [Halteromyces radiatus]|uniref:NUC173 domain-containing protein n=1 Tax=Halteromyces radiatus TaxID=101107 RepID=UPI00221E8941|nr:NUC173 domain-containing protein [Halteromyces radiatus]KAI8085055.1 NUC173 domain-containing protein [Halteromyces radiatus]